MNIELVTADYTHPKHAKDIVYLLEKYALDPMGGAEALSAHTRENLVEELSKRAHAWSLICYVDDKPAGLSNCFDGFSTFSCTALVNIHDVVVLKEFRGLGLSQRILKRVAEIARDKGCSKLTLEVLQGNTVAQNAYLKFGFAGYELAPEMGQAMFWQMPLNDSTE